MPSGCRCTSLRTALHSPRGLGRVIFHAWHWVFDREAHPLRLAAVQSGDASGYAALARIRNQRVRQRLYVIGALAGLLILASALVLIAAAGLAQLGPARRWRSPCSAGSAGRPASRSCSPPSSPRRPSG